MSQRVAVFGATGVAGSGILEACLAAPDVSDVRAIVRRPLDVTSRDLQGLGLQGVVCVRPGAIDGGRFPDGASWSYRLGVFLLPVFSLFRSAYIKSNDLGRALLQLAREGKRDGVLDNTALRDAVDRTGSQL